MTGPENDAETLEKISKLLRLPYLFDAARLALKLAEIAQAVQENKDGFQKLVDDSTQLVVVFYRSYQGAPNQEDWLSSEGIRTASKSLERCLDDILRFGTKKVERNRFFGVFYYFADANTIRKYHQKLASVTTQFKNSAQENLSPDSKGQSDLTKQLNRVQAASFGTAIQEEYRAWQGVDMINMRNSGIAFGEGSVVVENRAYHSVNHTTVIVVA